MEKGRKDPLFIGILPGWSQLPVLSQAKTGARSFLQVSLSVARAQTLVSPSAIFIRLVAGSLIRSGAARTSICTHRNATVRGYGFIHLHTMLAFPRMPFMLHIS